MAYKATVGSISSGTLRTADLVESFAWELKQLIASDPPVVPLYTALLARVENWDGADTTAEDFSESDYDSEGSGLVDELTTALEEFAPPYCYFGTHEGDGADFGFWPSIESIEELPRVEDSDGAKALGEDSIFINDHGNVTVYGGDGRVILELV
jgi:hypothetical protein